MKLSHIANRLISPFLKKYGYRIERLDYSQESAFLIQKKLIPEPSIIFDVGAHHGETIKKYINLFGSSPQIYSFEPFSDSYEKLLLNASGFTNVSCNQVGLSNFTGRADFYVNAMDATNSLLGFDSEKIKLLGFGDTSTVQNVGKSQIDVITLDDFCADNKIEAIDILKLDVQGAELIALDGAKKMLEAKKIKSIYTEIAFSAVYQKQALFGSICEFLSNYSINLFSFYNLIYNRHGRLVSGDAIFIQENR